MTQTSAKSPLPSKSKVTATLKDRMLRVVPPKVAAGG